MGYGSPAPRPWERLPSPRPQHLAEYIHNCSLCQVKNVRLGCKTYKSGQTVPKNVGTISPAHGLDKKSRLIVMSG